MITDFFDDPVHSASIREYYSHIEDINERHGKLGDHLKVTRCGYEHHGIYVGNGEVIEYDGPDGGGLVQQVSLTLFAGDLLITTVPSPRVFSREDVVERARSRLGEMEYNLITNNCEHFCNWCRSGIHFSFQVVANLPYNIINFVKHLMLKTTKLGRLKSQRIKHEEITRQILHYLLVSRIDYMEFSKNELRNKEKQFNLIIESFNNSIVKENLNDASDALNRFTKLYNIKLPYKNFDEFDLLMKTDPSKLKFIKN
ncbi:MAG: lecithin retinol acyltransferase family protein [Candidatus Delongbacteria bacterium]